MAEQEHHCPFLNRNDARCAERFHLDSLEFAFEHCFDQYQACPTYAERLRERRQRQSAAGLLAGGAAASPSLDAGTTPAHSLPAETLDAANLPRPKFFQVTLGALRRRTAAPAFQAHEQAHGQRVAG